MYALHTSLGSCDALAADCVGHTCACAAICGLQLEQPLNVLNVLVEAPVPHSHDANCVGRWSDGSEVSRTHSCCCCCGCLPYGILNQKTTRNQQQHAGCVGPQEAGQTAHSPSAGLAPGPSTGCAASQAQGTQQSPWRCVSRRADDTAQLDMQIPILCTESSARHQQQPGKPNSHAHGAWQPL